MDRLQILTSDSSGNEVICEVKIKPDGSVSLDSLTAQFPGAIGLWYRCGSGDSELRSVTLIDDAFHRPDELKQWSEAVYFCAYPSLNGNSEESQAHEPNQVVSNGQEHFNEHQDHQETDYLTENHNGHRSESTDQLNGVDKDVYNSDDPACIDLIILGLPYDFTEQDLRNYFDSIIRCNCLSMAQIKRNHLGESRGFGFVRFVDSTSQEAALSIQFYQIGNRRCEIKIPNSRKQQQQQQQQQQPTPPQSVVTDNTEKVVAHHHHHHHQLASSPTLSRRVYVGGITSKLTEKSLFEYFTNQLGLEVTNVYLSRRHERSFAFVTFSDADSAAGLIGKGFDIDGVSVFIANAKPIQQHQQQQQQQPQIHQPHQTQQPAYLPANLPQVAPPAAAPVAQYYAYQHQNQPHQQLHPGAAPSLPHQYQPPQHQLVSYAPNLQHQQQLINMPIYRPNPYLHLPVYQQAVQQAPPIQWQ